ncbi:MAG: DUF423 domain-containing protein [Anaerolineae bacterium]|nr:DUF423 domain-containing protein [Anaerolineae bacterium]
MKKVSTMQQLIVLAAIFGALGVGLGAFGAHGLSAILEANGRAETFRTGTHYHLIHAVVLLAAAWLSTQVDSNLVLYAGYAFVAGILLFSGSLYILAIFNIGIMGAVAPLGGTAFIIGWVLLGVAAFQITPGS